MKVGLLNSSTRLQLEAVEHSGDLLLESYKSSSTTTFFTFLKLLNFTLSNILMQMVKIPNLKLHCDPYLFFDIISLKIQELIAWMHHCTNNVYYNVYQEPTDIPSRKKKWGWSVSEVGVSEEGVCCKDHLPVKFNDPKFKNEIFVRIDIDDSIHTSVCNQFFLLLKHFVCQKLIQVYA